MYKTYRKYPDALCRIPLFLPIKQRESYHSRTIETSWGSVTVNVNALSTWDEDIFIALLNEGDYYKDYEDFGLIVYKDKTISTLIKDIGKPVNPKYTAMVRKSLEFLATTTVTITTNTFSFEGKLIDTYVNNPKDIKIILPTEISNPMKLMELGEQEKHKGTLRNISIPIREELNPTGKALHRFMTGHQVLTLYRFDLEMLNKVIAPHMRLGNFRTAVKPSLKMLVSCGFLSEGEIVTENGKEILKYRRTNKQGRGNG